MCPSLEITEGLRVLRMLERRTFITGLVSLIAAPAIVRAGSLMPVRAMPDLDAWGSSVDWRDLIDAQRRLNFYRSEMLKCMVPVRWITKAEALDMFPDPRAVA